MSLFDQIENIRKKPEHIRMRYVWFMVILFMIFVITIWIFSLKSGQPVGTLAPNEIINPDVMSQFEEQKDSLKGATQGFQNALQEGGNNEN